MSQGSVTPESWEAPAHLCNLGLDVPCTYVLPDETLRILSAIVSAALKAEERHPSEAA